MIRATLNPFRPTRWEHHTDGRPLIWFTEEAQELAAEKSTYVYGTRGTGKTTLLKGICWEDLCFNESLRIQRRLGDFGSIGVYVRFPDHIAASMSFEDWASIFPGIANPHFEFYRFFTLAVESTCIERTAEACHSLRELGEISVEAPQEVRLVADFVTEFPALLSFSPVRPATLLELARALRALVSRMNQACGRNTVATLVDQLPVREPYQMLAYFAERASAIIRLNTSRGSRPIGFKFCLDDCEVLNPLQRKSLNSLIRLSRAPCSWVVSSVGGGRDDSETFIESQPLTDADRRVISLDGRDDAGFRQLCQSVVSLRLIFAGSHSARTSFTQEQVADFFNLERRLGRRDVNDMMESLVRRSARPLAKNLEAGAQHLLRLLKQKRTRMSSHSDERGGRLPFYEAYVLMLSRGREDSFKQTIDISDIAKLDDYIDSFGQPGFQAWLRRKQRGALLHFATALGVRRIPFAGANVIVSLSDGSIRDFLEIMGEVYEASVTDHNWDPKDAANLDRFASSGSQIATRIQTSGIYSASDTYYEGVSHRSEIDTDVISRLIAGLGIYTSLLQTSPSDPKTLSTAERGVFFVDYTSTFSPDGLTESAKFVASAIRQAELAGYLRPVEISRFQTAALDGQYRSIAFRLHRRFAPRFRFSFRGAYEGVSLDPDDLAKLCVGGPHLTAKDWAEGLAARSPRTTPIQLEFPRIEPPSDE
jgi:hypothetical protein